LGNEKGVTGRQEEKRKKRGRKKRGKKRGRTSFLEQLEGALSGDV
jgi:hypothetical protein